MLVCFTQISWAQNEIVVTGRRGSSGLMCDAAMDRHDQCMQESSEESIRVCQADESEDMASCTAFEREVRTRCLATANAACPAGAIESADYSSIVPGEGARSLTGATTGGTRTSGAGSSMGVQDKINQLEERLQVCRQRLRQTETCCTNPMSCLTNDGSDSSRNTGVFMALQIAAGSVTQMAGLAGSCGTLGKVSTGMAAINTALAFKCSQKIAQCNSACGEIATAAQAEVRRCRASGGCASDLDVAEDECARPTSNPPTQTETQNYNNCLNRRKREITNSAIADFNRIAGDANDCDTWGGRAVEQQSQAIASMYAAKIAGLCQQQAQATNPNNVATNAFNVNCSDPTNAANPVCQNQCNRANAANDPVCAQLLGLGTSGFGNGNAIDGLANANGGAGANGAIDEFEDPQLALDAAIDPRANSANVGSQSGGGVPGGGGGSAGGGDPGAAGGAGGEGLNTNVLTGVKSGNGYTQPFVRSSLGGGYSSPGAGRGVASEKGKPFNPRDFLPGGKLDPKRKLAGLASSTPEIGAVHGNIFTNITNRFMQVCLRDGLFDCQTLRKNSKPRN